MSDEQSRESKELSFEDIVAVRDDLIERLEMPDWNGHVYVRSLNGIERERWENSLFETDRKGRKRPKVKTDIRADLAAQVLCNSSGERICKSADQVRQLARKNARMLQLIFEKAQYLSGLSDDAIEELEGNLKGQTGDD